MLAGVVETGEQLSRGAFELGVPVQAPTRADGG